jgi:hypothetical protein
MKLSREFQDEQRALEWELALKAAGYRAWRKRKPDGLWEVIWLATTSHLSLDQLLQNASDAGASRLEVVHPQYSRNGWMAAR